MTERIRALEAIARTLEGAQVGVYQLAFAHLPAGAALRVAAAGSHGEPPAPIPGLTSPLLGLTGHLRGPGAPALAPVAPEAPLPAGPAGEVLRVEPPQAVAAGPADPGASAAEGPRGDDLRAGAAGVEDAGEEDTRVIGPVLVFAPIPEPRGAGAVEVSADAEPEGFGDGIEDTPTLHDTPTPQPSAGAAAASGGPGAADPDPDAFDEPTFLGMTPASAFGPDGDSASDGDSGLDGGSGLYGGSGPAGWSSRGLASAPAAAAEPSLFGDDADEEATLADSDAALDDEEPFGALPAPGRDPAVAFSDGLDDDPSDGGPADGDAHAGPAPGGGAQVKAWGRPPRAGGGSAPGPAVQLRFIRPEPEGADPFAEGEGWAGTAPSPVDAGDAFGDDEEEEATRVGTAAVSLRAAVDAALRAEPHAGPVDADFDGDQLEFEPSAPAPAPARPAAAPPARPALAAAPAMSAPRLGAPRVVEPEPDRPEGATGAAIQILGFGKSRTLTPTLALEGAPEKLEGEGDGDVGFSVAFEEPDEESTGPRIPMLTEGAPVPERPTVGFSGGGAFVPSGEPALAPQTAAGFLARARAAEQAGNLRDAVECYGDLLSFDPYSLDAHLGRGRCLVDLGDYGAAMSDFTRAEDLAPDSPEPVVEMGNLYFARKEYKKAIAYYDHAIEQSPNHAMALCRRGICYYHRKRMSEAHADLKRAEALGAQVPGLQRYIQMTARGPTKR